MCSRSQSKSRVLGFASVPAGGICSDGIYEVLCVIQEGYSFVSYLTGEVMLSTTPVVFSSCQDAAASLSTAAAIGYSNC